MITFAGHAGVALITAFLLGIDPLIALIGGFLPDVDSITFLLKIKWNKGHRKITHSLLFLAPFVILSFINPFFLPLAVGILTHYVTDLDYWGIPLFYPFTNKYYSINKVDHTKSFDSPDKYLKDFFKKRGKRFWIEWGLLAVGILLNRNYLTALLNTLLGI